MPLKKRKSRRPGKPATPSELITNGSDFSIAVVDLDLDKRTVDSVDASIWNALMDGHFRLAVPCDTCGRFLTANSSKKAHRGPRCRAKVAAK
jgi:hypothetical protein